MARHWWTVIGFVVLLGFLAFGLTRDPNILPSPFIGKPAPEFSLPTVLDPEKMIGTDVYRNQYALINVWATWCVGCRQEHEFLLRLAESGAIPIYGINWRDNRAEAMNWLQQLGNPYVASGYDADGRVGINWGVYGAPETFLLDPDGIVLYKHLGPLNRAAWEQDFVPLINGGAKK